MRAARLVQIVRRYLSVNQLYTPLTFNGLLTLLLCITVMRTRCCIQNEAAYRIRTWKKIIMPAVRTCDPPGAGDWPVTVAVKAAGAGE